MLLRELAVGTEIELEVIAGSKKFDIPLRVEKIDPNYIYTNSFRYGGKVVDFKQKGFEHLLFNIYATDSKNQGRFVWKGVSLEVANVRGAAYYSIHTKGMLQQGVAVNRRREKRIVIDLQGQAFSDSSGRTAFVKIHDISTQGVSFYATPDFSAENEMIDLRFVDQVADKTFDLGVEAVCVREVPMTATSTLYGCRLRSPNREFQTYICFKKLIQQKMERDALFLNENF